MVTIPLTQRLTFRLLAPMVLGAIAVSLLITSIAMYYGRLWVIRDVEERFQGIRNVLRNGTFPLRAPILGALAELTSTDLVAFEPASSALLHTMGEGVDDRKLQSLFADWEAIEGEDDRPAEVIIGDRSYLAYRVQREMADGSYRQPVLVLFDRARIRAASYRAATWPVAVGAITILVVSGLEWYSISRLIRRLHRLRRHLGKVAQGDFASKLTATSSDEIAQLERSANSMAEQLHALWDQLDRRQSEQLLHRIASGLAHQLRNTLTGARLALELAATDGMSLREAEGVQVALRQLAFAEEYVDRVLRLGSQATRTPQPQLLHDTLDDLQTALTPVASHLKVNLTWQLGAIDRSVQVADGPSFYAAISNLIINALEAGQNVTVSVAMRAGKVHVEVVDDGPGIPEELQSKVFEPFVTSKQEGLGLGLPLVQRVAVRMQGFVYWERRDGTTVFGFVCPVDRCRGADCEVKFRARSSEDD